MSTVEEFKTGSRWFDAEQAVRIGHAAIAELEAENEWLRGENEERYATWLTTVQQRADKAEATVERQDLQEEIFAEAVDDLYAQLEDADVTTKRLTWQRDYAVEQWAGGMSEHTSRDWSDAEVLAILERRWAERGGHERLC